MYETWRNLGGFFFREGRNIALMISYRKIAYNEGNLTFKSILRWSNWIHLYPLIRYEKENNGPWRTSIHSLERRHCSGNLFPFKTLIRSKSGERERARQARDARSAKSPNSAWARHAIVRLYRRNSSISLLSGIFKQRIQTNLSNAREIPRPCVLANVGRSWPFVSVMSVVTISMIQILIRSIHKR